MESNWRLNIPDIGLTGKGYTLIARLVTPIEGYDYLCRRESGTGTALLMTPLIFPDGRLVDQFTIISVTGSFPHGYAVESD